MNGNNSNNQRLHLNYLDGLRGIASLYVVLVHVEPSRGEELSTFWSLFEKTLRYGAFSVVIFIVLSGYVLMLPVARSQSGYLSGSLTNYIKRRARRILPPYYAALFLCLLLALVIFVLENFTNFKWNPVAGEGPFSPRFSFIDVLSHLLLIHNLSPITHHSINPPMWSVATEWQLYFIFPLLLLPIWRHFGLTRVVVIAFIIGIVPFYTLNASSVSAGSWFVGLFALGMAAADIGFSEKPSLIAIKNSLPWGVLAFAFTVIAFITEWKQLGLDIWIGQAFCGLASACLFVYCTKVVINRRKLPHLLGLFEHSWIVKLGIFSYSLYLIHGPVLVLLRYSLFYLPLSSSMFAAISYLAGVIMSLIIAYWFHLVFERPFIPGFRKKSQA